jgi:hypothetical protein
MAALSYVFAHKKKPRSVLRDDLRLKDAPSVFQGAQLLSNRIAWFSSSWGKTLWPLAFYRGSRCKTVPTSRGLELVPTTAEDRSNCGERVIVTSFVNHNSGVRVCHFMEPTPVV